LAKNCQKKCLTSTPSRAIIGGPLTSEPGRFHYTTRHRKSQEKNSKIFKIFCFSRYCEKIHKLVFRKMKNFQGVKFVKVWTFTN